MFSWSFLLLCFGLGLLQVLAALPWIFALIRGDRTIQDIASGAGKSFASIPWLIAAPRGPGHVIFAIRIFRLVVSAITVAIVIGGVIGSQARAGLEGWGYAYGGVLQVQLTLDAIILAIWLMLRVWPKGGAVAQAAFREGVRQPMFWLIVSFAFLALTAAPIIPYFTFGEDYIMTKELGYDTIMLGTVVFGVLAATLFVTDEIEGRTAITLMSKPVSRRQFLLGKFVGIMLASALMFGILGFYFQDVLLFKHWFDKDDPVAVPEWINSTLARLTVGGDATDFLRGFGMWTQHMLDTLPGLVLSFCQVMVLVAFAVSFATRVPMVVNLTAILAIYFLAHLSPVLLQISTAAQAHPDQAAGSEVFASTVLKFAAQVFDTLLPALEFFRISPRLVGDQPPEPGVYSLYLGSVFFYGILYTTIVLIFGLILFEDRDLA